MKYLVITATPKTTYTHLEVEADDPDEAKRKAEEYGDGYAPEGVELVGESLGPDDEPVEVIDVSEIQ